MVQANIDRASALILNHAETKGGTYRALGIPVVYVLPELASSGYGVEAFKWLGDIAETDNGLSFRCYSVLAKKYSCFIAYGFPRKYKDKYFISHGVVSPKGDLIGIYDKLHICQFGYCVEKNYFSCPTEEGESPRLVVFKAGNFNVALTICYDIRFPELWRKLALECGAHLILHPGGWPRDGGFYTWHAFAKTRAIENQVYVMSNNRASENNGASIFIPPYLDKNTHTIELGTDEGVLEGRLSMNHINFVRKTYNYRGDRLTKY